MATLSLESRLHHSECVPNLESLLDEIIIIIIIIIIKNLLLIYLFIIIIY